MNAEKLEPGRRSGQEPAGDLWRHTLARIPTLFGRLVYLASLRDESGGEYRHLGLEQMVGDEEAAETLRRSHARVFRDWLCLNLEQQRSDLQEYLAETSNPAAVLAEWTESGAYRTWASADAQDVERRLFSSDLETLLDLLRSDYGAVSPDRES